MNTTNRSLVRPQAQEPYKPLNQNRLSGFLFSGEVRLNTETEHLRVFPESFTPDP